MTMSLETLTLQSFQASIGAIATLGREDARVELRLEAANPSSYPSARPSGGFSLLLTGPLQPALGQGTYPIEIDGLGSLELFMTPVAQGADRRSYEVVFN